MLKSVSDSVSQNLFNDKLLYRPVATNPSVDIPLALSNSSETTHTSKPSLGISYQIDVDQTCMDTVHAYLHESPPEKAFSWMPDKWVKMNDSMKYCHTDNQKAYDDLPRTADGNIDIEKISRFEHWNEEGFKRIFTENEIAYCNKFENKLEHFCGFYCVKEALVKALDDTGIHFSSIEILHNENGKPYINRTKYINQILKEHFYNTLEISISHCKEYATAVVLVQ